MIGKSPWVATVILVREKDGTLGFGLNYRCLNVVIIRGI